MSDVVKIIFAVVVADLVLKSIKNLKLLSTPITTPETKQPVKKDLATASIEDAMRVVEVLKKREDTRELFANKIDPSLFSELGWQQARIIFKLHDQYIMPTGKSFIKGRNMCYFYVAWAEKNENVREDTALRILKVRGYGKMFDASRLIFNSATFGFYWVIFTFVINLTPAEYVEITKRNKYTVLKKETVMNLPSLDKTYGEISDDTVIQEDALNYIKTQ